MDRPKNGVAYVPETEFARERSPEIVAHLHAPRPVRARVTTSADFGFDCPKCGIGWVAGSVEVGKTAVGVPCDTCDATFRVEACEEGGDA